jgi:hypothetical protein
MSEMDGTGYIMRMSAFFYLQHRYLPSAAEGLVSVDFSEQASSVPFCLFFHNSVSLCTLYSVGYM